jgi:hypothetical protein
MTTLPRNYATAQTTINTDFYIPACSSHGLFSKGIDHQHGRFISFKIMFYLLTSKLTARLRYYRMLTKYRTT